MPCARYAPSRFIRTGRTTGTRRCTPTRSWSCPIFVRGSKETLIGEQFHFCRRKERIAAENARLSESLALAEKRNRETQKIVREDVESRQGAVRPRALFLSFTPFAYEPSIDWANGYLFDYNEGRPSDKTESRATTRAATATSSSCSTLATGCVPAS